MAPLPAERITDNITRGLFPLEVNEVNQLIESPCLRIEEIISIAQYSVGGKRLRTAPVIVLPRNDVFDETRLVPDNPGEFGARNELYRHFGLQVRYYWLDCYKGSQREEEQPRLVVKVEDIEEGEGRLDPITIGTLVTREDTKNHKVILKRSSRRILTSLLVINKRDWNQVIENGIVYGIVNESGFPHIEEIALPGMKAAQFGLVSPDKSFAGYGYYRGELVPYGKDTKYQDRDSSELFVARNPYAFITDMSELDEGKLGSWKPVAVFHDEAWDPQWSPHQTSPPEIKWPR